MLGIKSPSTYHRYEMGTRSPGQKKLQEMADYFQCDVIDLLPVASAQILRRLRNTLWDLVESDAALGTKFNALLNYVRWAFPAGEMEGDQSVNKQAKDVLDIIGMKGLEKNAQHTDSS